MHLRMYLPHPRNDTCLVLCHRCLPVVRQVIDDTVGNTLAAASTLTADIRSNLNGGGGGNKVRAACRRLLPSVFVCSFCLVGAAYALDGGLPELTACADTLQEAAQMVGKKIAELCLSMNIDKVCFDRGGNIYHGRVQVSPPRCT